jgi:hypothetical protein
MWTARACLIIPPCAASVLLVVHRWAVRWIDVRS